MWLRYKTTKVSAPIKLLLLLLMMKVESLLRIDLPTSSLFHIRLLLYYFVANVDHSIHNSFR
jgi:hypothetical protein